MTMSKTSKYLNVAVTGNPPFIEYPINTTTLVCDALPEIIHRPESKKDIRILKYHRDTLDTYSNVRQVSHDIWTGNRSHFLPKADNTEDQQHIEIDLIVHLGMIALDWDPNQFRFETIARRDGYILPGDDGKLVDSDHLRALGLPEVLSTSLDVHVAWRKVKEQYPNITTCVSDDAGLYFCEFRLYSSLAEPLLVKDFSNKQGRVVFEHIPQAHNKEAIDLARDITVSFIKGLAEDPIFR